MTAPIAGVMETILNGVTSAQAGTIYQARPLNRAFQAIVNGSGAVSATVLIEVSNDGINFATRSTLSLSGTTGYASQAYVDTLSPFPFVRGSLTAISGAGAAATLTMAGSNP